MIDVLTWVVVVVVVVVAACAVVVVVLSDITVCLLTN
jgi:hypothetical protein